MKIEHIVYKGKKILVINFFECQTHNEMVEIIQNLEKEYNKSIEPILTLEDYTDAHVSSEFMAEAKRLGKDLFSKKRTKGAVLGIQGIKKLLLKSYNSYTGENLIPFDSKEEALEYLVS